MSVLPGSTCRGPKSTAAGKAEIYAEAAGVGVGRVSEIEDMNPGIVSGDAERGMHGAAMEDDPPTVRAADPGAIVVGAAVNVIYEIEF
nr:SIMPL domain-containing protein [Rhodopirellula sp. SM50]